MVNGPFLRNPVYYWSVVSVSLSCTRLRRHERSSLTTSDHSEGIVNAGHRHTGQASSALGTAMDGCYRETRQRPCSGERSLRMQPAATQCESIAPDCGVRTLLIVDTAHGSSPNCSAPGPNARKLPLICRALHAGANFPRNPRSLEINGQR